MSEPIVWFDGKFMRESEARLPLLTHSFHYGTGIFEGIRAYYDRESGEMLMFRPLEHFRRMHANVRLLNIRLPLPPEALVGICAELIRNNGFTTDVYIRPIAFKSAQRIGVSLPEGDSLAIIAVPMGDYLDTSKGLRCEVSSWRRLQDNSIPCRAKICGAYVNSALAAQEARDRGFDEGIFLNEDGHVAEGSAENIFLVRDGGLVTPDTSQGILEGITRESVIRLAKELFGIETEQRVVDRTELYVADEVFFTGTAAKIAPVTQIDGRDIGDGSVGPVTRKLQEAYTLAVRGRSPAHRDWVVPVYEVSEAAHGWGV